MLLANEDAATTVKHTLKRVPTRPAVPDVVLDRTKTGGADGAETGLSAPADVDEVVVGVSIGVVPVAAVLVGAFVDDIGIGTVAGGALVGACSEETGAAITATGGWVGTETEAPPEMFVKPSKPVVQ